MRAAKMRNSPAPSITLSPCFTHNFIDRFEPLRACEIHCLCASMSSYREAQLLFSYSFCMVEKSRIISVSAFCTHTHTHFDTNARSPSLSCQNSQTHTHTHKPTPGHACVFIHSFTHTAFMKRALARTFDHRSAVAPSAESVCVCMCCVYAMHI